MEMVSKNTPQLYNQVFIASEEVWKTIHKIEMYDDIMAFILEIVLVNYWQCGSESRFNDNMNSLL